MSLKTKVKNGIGIFLVVLSVCCGSPLFAGLQPEEGMDLSKPRIWTAVTGHQLKAAYEGDGNKIRLLANGGKIKTILLEKLSEADQRLLEHLTREEKRSGKLAFRIPAGMARSIHLSDFLLKRNKNALMEKKVWNITRI